MLQVRCALLDGQDVRDLRAPVCSCPMAQTAGTAGEVKKVNTRVCVVTVACDTILSID